jgi:hypothetical protein
MKSGLLDTVAYVLSTYEARLESHIAGSFAGMDFTGMININSRTPQGRVLMLS